MFVIFLGDIYHPKMKQMDVIHIVYSEYVKLHKEPRFDLGNSFTILNVIEAPAKIEFFSNQSTTYNLEEIYDSMLLVMMNAFRFSVLQGVLP